MKIWFFFELLYVWIINRDFSYVFFVFSFFISFTKRALKTRMSDDTSRSLTNSKIFFFNKSLIFFCLESMNWNEWNKFLIKKQSESSIDRLKWLSIDSFVWFMKKQKSESMTKLILTKNFFDFSRSRLIDCEFDDSMRSVSFDAFRWFEISFFWLISLKSFRSIVSMLFWLI